MKLFAGGFSNWVWRLAAIAALVAFAWAGWSTLLARFSQRDPRLVIDNQRLNFGRIPLGSKVRRSFKITNAGDVPLIISEIRSGCGCLAISMPENTIAPQQTSDLYVTLGAEFARKQMVSLLVKTNDPQRKLVTLEVHSESVADPAVEPQRVDFGRVHDSPTGPLENKLTLKLGEAFLSQNDLGSVRITCAAPYYAVDATSPWTGNSKVITLLLREDAPLGDIYTELSVAGGSSELTIPVTCYKRGPFFALPQMLIFGPLSPSDEAVHETVELRLRPSLTEGAAGSEEPPLACDRVTVDDAFGGALSAVPSVVESGAWGYI